MDGWMDVRIKAKGDINPSGQSIIAQTTASQQTTSAQQTTSQPTTVDKPTLPSQPPNAEAAKAQPEEEIH